MTEGHLRISRLTLRHYRSVLAETVYFGNPLFLVGRNGAGKSNLIDAIQLLGQCVTTPLASIVENRGGFGALIYKAPLEDGFLVDEWGNMLVNERGEMLQAPHSTGRRTLLGVRMDFDRSPAAEGGAGWYAFELGQGSDCEFGVSHEQACLADDQGRRSWFDRQKNRFQGSLPSLQPVVRHDALALPLVGAMREFEPISATLGGIQVLRVQPQALRGLCALGQQSRIAGDGGNLPQFLEYLSARHPASLKRLGELLGTIAPGLESVGAAHRQRSGGTVLVLEFLQAWETGSQRLLSTFEASQMSDGTLRAAALLAAAFQEPAPSLIAIEEPELTIHPEALGTILDAIRGLSKRTQVVVTTHSPELLDAKWIKPESIRILTWEKGATHVQPLGSASVKALQQHLMGAGEQFRSNALRAEHEEFFAEESGKQPELFEHLP